MPQRFLRPGITNSERWNAVSFEAQSLYVRILTLVDDFGRYDARTPILHSHCFALRPDIKQAKTLQLRNELHNHGLIQVYSVDGREYLQVLQWQERARQDKSKFPEPSAECETAAELLDNPQDSAADGSGPLRNPASIDHRPSTIDHRPSTLAISSPPGASAPRNGVHSETELRLGRLFRRKETTRWSAKELETLRKLEPIPEDELKAIETYYSAKLPETSDYRRRDLITLLNNWSGELDRARKVKINTGY